MSGIPRCSLVHRPTAVGIFNREFRERKAQVLHANLKWSYHCPDFTRADPFPEDQFCARSMPSGPDSRSQNPVSFAFELHGDLRRLAG